MSKKRMSLVDHAWLRMDSPENYMIITGLMTFDAPLTASKFRDVLQDTVLSYSRFRQHLVYDPLRLRRPVWEEDPAFDWNYHLVKVTLSPPGDRSTLQDLVSELMGRELDYSRPLWRYYIIEKYGDGSAVIGRFHHCLADGVALIRVLLNMADLPPGVERPAYQPPESYPLNTPASLLEETLAQISPTIRSATRTARGIARESLKSLTDPSLAAKRARFGADIVTAVGRLALRWPDPETLLKGPLSVEKRAVWSDPIPLQDVKRIGRAFGATVNDVLLSVVAGAIRRYLKGREEPVDGLSLRGIIPVDLRGCDPIEDLGNKFGLVFGSLPVGIADPVERLRSLKCGMDGIKATPEALAAYAILGTLGGVPLSIQNIAISIFDTKGSAIMTNVRGPGEKLSIAGAPINTVMAWVPEAGRVSTGVSIISYNNRVWLGFATDKSLVPDPEQILQEFTTEFEQMKEQAEQVLARRRQPLVPMLSQLDEALNKVDEFLASAKASPAPQIEPPPPVQACCQGRTRSGSPCKNPPLPGKAFCRVHSKKAEKVIGE